jgi:hypothetical protein
MFKANATKNRKERKYCRYKDRKSSVVGKDYFKIVDSTVREGNIMHGD